MEKFRRMERNVALNEMRWTWRIQLRFATTSSLAYLYEIQLRKIPITPLIAMHSQRLAVAYTISYPCSCRLSLLAAAFSSSLASSRHSTQIFGFVTVARSCKRTSSFVPNPAHDKYCNILFECTRAIRLVPQNDSTFILIARVEKRHEEWKECNGEMST